MLDGSERHLGTPGRKAFVLNRKQRHAETMSTQNGGMIPDVDNDARSPRDPVEGELCKENKH